MSRFKIGDKVLIGGSIITRHLKQHGKVVGVHASSRTRPGVTSLDEYTVRFDDGKEVQFYDNQIIAGTDERTPRAAD
jgi:hypothetical protein